ncbi:MAG TPA: hypothetical protein VGB23_09310 [Nitrospirota bacterium]
MRRAFLTIPAIMLIASAALAHSPMNRFWGEVPVDMLLSGDVLITKPLIVPKDVTLTIEAGAVVRFEGTKGRDNRIVVAGRLVAQGTKLKPIKFVPKDKDSGPWQGIVFEPGGKGSLANCVVEGATKGIVDPSDGAALSGVEVR